MPRILTMCNSNLAGGAARAAYRLHQALRLAGLDARMLVQHKIGDDPTVIGPEGAAGRFAMRLRSRLDRLPLKLYRARRDMVFSPGVVPRSKSRHIAALRPDIVHLHWINDGFIGIDAVRRIRQPIVWTLHDLWAMTGGCHYDAECGRWTLGCGRCPALNSDAKRDLSAFLWRYKRRIWRELPITIVTPSRWMAAQAKSSPLLGGFRTEVIPNCIDLQAFQPHDRGASRSRFGLPLDRRLILFGANYSTADPRKGFDLLRAAMDRLAACWSVPEPYEVVVFGGSQRGRREAFGTYCHFLGELTDDESLAAAYAAADVFVAPSRQDNLPNTVMEAMACGTPSVAFNVGGLSDLVEHCRTGYLARPFDVEDLAQGIAWTQAEPERQAMLRQAARQKAEREYGFAAVGARHRELYEDLLGLSEHASSASAGRPEPLRARSR